MKLKEEIVRMKNRSQASKVIKERRNTETNVLFKYERGKEVYQEEGSTEEGQVLSVWASYLI